MSLRHPKRLWTVTRGLWEDLSTLPPGRSSRVISERAIFSRNLHVTSPRFILDLFQNLLRTKTGSWLELLLTKRLIMPMKDSLRGRIKTRSLITTTRISNKWCWTMAQPRLTPRQQAPIREEDNYRPTTVPQSMSCQRVFLNRETWSTKMKYSHLPMIGAKRQISLHHKPEWISEFSVISMSTLCSLQPLQ